MAFRRLCTAAATETKKSSMETAKNATTGVGLPLYRRLSALGADPEGSVKNTMNKWLREGKSIRAREIVTYVKELRRYKRFEHALEVPLIHTNVNVSDSPQYNTHCNIFLLLI